MMESWCRAVLEWVNCLDILEANVNDLGDLRDGKFFAKLIKILSAKEFENEDYNGDKNLVSRFIRETYPEFLDKSKTPEGDCNEIHIASLLLLHSSHEPKLHRPMCIKLSNETQIKIKSFLEKVLDYGCSVTKDNINTAIMETADYLVRTPPVTPKMRPLKDFFNSPATTVRKNYNRIMDERTREVRSLKAQLETERFEKADLQEDLEIQRQKNNSLQQRLQEKIAEIKKMKEEPVRFETPQSSKKKKDVRTPRNRVNTKVQELTEKIELLKSEIINLQDDNQSLMRKLTSVERNCITFKERSRMNEKNLETLLIQADLKDQEIEELKHHNEELRTHIQEMRRQTIAEQSFEMEMTAMSPSNSMLNGSEVLSSVIDIQLQEAKEQSKVFKSQVEDLNQRLKSLHEDYETLQQSNKTLEAEVSLLQSTKKELSEVRVELDERIEASNTLGKEKSHFIEQTAKFEGLCLTKEKLLLEAEQQNEILKINLIDLENKLKTAHDSLNKEITKVNDLEALVSHKSDILKTESMRYEDLDQKHTKLKQQNSEIIREAEELKNLVSSKEDSLSQAQEQIKALEIDLCDIKSELRNTEDLLDSERTRVEDLESFISQMKLENEETCKSQLSKYQNLGKKYADLEKEKLSLSQRMEDLNLRIASNESILKEYSEKNLRLASDLQDLEDKLQASQHTLTEEKKKVENLQSTITQVKTEKERFMECQFSKYQTLEEKYENLEREKLSLLKNIKDLNDVVSSKEQLLKQYCEEKENLESTIQKLNEQLLTTQDSLGQERTRVKDLESMINMMKQEKAEALQTQLTSYQALEKVYNSLQQEKINLGTEIDRVNNLISSKEEMLQKSEQQNKKLELDLRDVNNNLQTVKDLLNSEKARADELEFTLKQTKSQYEDTINGQMSKYKNLEEKYANLEEERSNLLQETVNLNCKIAADESVLMQSRRENENLSSELEELNNKLQTVESSLAEEKSRVKDLESMTICMKQEKEDILDKQSINYQALEMKHKVVENEKLDLMKNTENLENLLSSKEELLQESRQYIIELEGDLGGVIDELNAATSNITSLEVTLSEANLEKERIVRLNEDFKAEITSLKCTENDLIQSKKQMHNEYQDLEREKLCLVKEVEELQKNISLKEESLTQTRQENETLRLQLKNLDNKIISIRSLLSERSSTVEDLESEIIQIKQEGADTLQSQLMNYKILEEKHMAVEKERRDLLEAAENLQNLLSSKEELLQQSQQHCVKLEGDLSEAKLEVKTVRDELHKTTTEIENLKSVLAQKKLEIEKILGLNEHFQAEINSLRSTENDLYEAKEKLHEENTALEKEKSRLLGKMEEFEINIRSKEESLTQIQEQNEALNSKLEHLDVEMKSVQDLLSAKSRVVEDLQSTIVQIEQEKAESIQNQLSNYQALEEKHRDIENEKLDLVKDTENLRNSLSAKEELLQRSQQHSAKLEGDLCVAKNETKLLQDKLDSATTKMNSLESALAQIQSETEKVIQSNEDLQAEINSLKCEKNDLYESRKELYEQSEELKQEKSRLLTEIEELKVNIESKEELLRQTQQRNDSKLNDLDEEMKQLQSLLVAKSTRVQDLEFAVEEIESARKESLDIIRKLEVENIEQKTLIESCTLILTELVKYSGQLIGNEKTDINDLSILDLSKELKTLINSMEVIQTTKDSELKNFEATVTELDLTISKLKTEMMHLKEMKARDDLIIAEYLKEINDLRAIAREKDTLLADVGKLKSQLSDERSKIDLLNEEKKLLGHNLRDVKNSLISLKSEKSILLKNVQNQNHEFLNKMAKVSGLIFKMQDQNNIDNSAMLNLREEKTSLTLKYEEEKKVRSELEAKFESLENESKSQMKEKKELKEKLNTIRVRNAKLEKNLDDLRKENKKLGSEKSSVEEQSRVEELSASISKLQLQIQELETKNIELSKRPTEQEFDSRVKEIHAEYDLKLEKIKQKMKTAYNEQIAKVNRDQEKLMQEKLNAHRVKMEEQCRKHAEEITKYKDHVTKLSSDYWDVGEKLLVEKQQKEHLAQQLQDLKMLSQYQRTASSNNALSQQIPINRSKTASLDRREFSTTTRDEASALRTVQTIKEEVTMCARRESIQSVQTLQGMGNAFKAEDEEGEVFNTNYLADMKAGRCTIAPDMERLSVLQMRNAQCKPHLKSSYPAETQFQPGTFTEEEIKSGSTIEDVFNDSLSQSLLPGEKTKKRDRTQTLYKRPGPPTPSKNGGRLSLQGNELKSPNSRILRERNVERRSTATPRRLKDLFGGSSRRQDENVSGTPKGRRLSSIFRKPK